MFVQYYRDAYDLGNDDCRYKEDGTLYTIDDLIKDKNVTDPEIIERMKKEHIRGHENFCWCHSCIS